MGNAGELGVTPVPSLNLVCTGDETSFSYITADEAKEKGLDVKKLSGTKFRQMLRAGEDIPEWFAFKSVVDVLRAEWKGALRNRAQLTDNAETFSTLELATSARVRFFP